MEATLVDRWAADESLPTLARVIRSASSFELDGPIDHLPDVVWPELTTGRVGASIGWFSVPRQLFSGEARPRPVRADDVDLTAVWDLASAAGRRVVAFDIPWAGRSHGTNGVHIWGWGTHDRPFGSGSDPEEAFGRLNTHGEHAVPHDHATRSHCDDHDDEPASYLDLLARLRRGAETKAALACDLLGREPWDLFYTAFSESHCVGHHFWHFHDPSSPWHDPEAPLELQGAVRSVYAAIDIALGQLLEAAGPGATTVVFTNHGMGPAVGGWQLLPEVLVRLGFGSGHGTASNLRSRLPEPVKRALRTAVRGRARERLQVTAGSLPFPLESPATRAVALQNSPCGAVRLNVKGREPYGSVEPGAEYDAACSELIRELEALEDPGSGEPVVAAARRADELYGARTHPNVPDVLVSFRRDLGPIVSVRSRRVGTVSLPFRTPALPRSGDHVRSSRLWLADTGASRGAAGRARSIDLVPTVLRLLDVPPPGSVDGRPLPTG